MRSSCDGKETNCGYSELKWFEESVSIDARDAEAPCDEIDAQVVRDVVYPKLAPCDTRVQAHSKISLVHLKSTANVDEAAVKTLEDTEEAMAEFAKSVVSVVLSRSSVFIVCECCCGQ